MGGLLLGERMEDHSELTALRGRVEEAERQRDGYKKACNDIVGEMLAKDEQDRIGHHIASLLSYTMIVQGLPAKMVNAQALRESVEMWREARKSVKADDISTVQSYRAERDVATARAEGAEERERRLVEIISGLVSHLELCRDMDFPGDSEEDKAVLASVNAALEEARAALAEMEKKR